MAEYERGIRWLYITSNLGGMAFPSIPLMSLLLALIVGDAHLSDPVTPSLSSQEGFKGGEEQGDVLGVRKYAVRSERVTTVGLYLNKQLARRKRGEIWHR